MSSKKYFFFLALLPVMGVNPPGVRNEPDISWGLRLFYMKGTPPRHRQRTPPRHRERSEAILCGHCHVWIASGFALAMTKAHATPESAPLSPLPSRGVKTPGGRNEPDISWGLRLFYMKGTPPRHCQRSEAILCGDCHVWIASDFALAMTKAPGGARYGL
jgi:hypothetical protein